MIHKKLLDFQKMNIVLKKDGVNPHFKSSYVTLNEVLDKVKGPLNDMGILIIQHGEHNGLATTLYDTEDKSAIYGFLPFSGATDAQKLGSNMTYLRRYSLISMLGLEDTDDDGNEASKPVVASKPTTTTTASGKVSNYVPEADSDVTEDLGGGVDEED